MSEMALSSVHVVWHVKEIQDGYLEENIFVGAYSTKENAEEAVSLIMDMDEFSTHPECFEIYEWSLDTDSWVDGFVTVYD